MPRRKKKGKDLPPLDFVESPLYQDAPLPDYDHNESSNPATVRAVAVHELENIPWVCCVVSKHMLIHEQQALSVFLFVFLSYRFRHK